jgi:hypothetical protein
MVTAERTIRMLIFVLLLSGLSTISAWASYTYLNDNIVLAIAGIPLSWGIILLVLYITFKKLNWDWWS